MASKNTGDRNLARCYNECKYCVNDIFYNRTIGERGMIIKSGINVAQYQESLKQMKTTEAKRTKESRKLTTSKQVKAETKEKTTSDSLKKPIKEAGRLNTNSNSIKEIDALSAMSELENFDI